MIDPSKNPPPPVPPLDARGLPVGYAFRAEWEITPRDTHAALHSSAPPLLLDCRRDEEWAFNRVEGAMHLPMAEIERRADELRDALEDAPEREVVVYCHHGVRSMRVTATLRAMGFANVRSMAGGVDAWSLSVDPRVPRY